MKKTIVLLFVYLISISCTTTTSLSTKTVKYDVISASSLGFNGNKVTSYNAIIKIGKVYYSAILDGKLKIEKIGSAIEK